MGGYGYSGMNYVDPIQQGIKTFGMLKDIDRADSADARANEQHAENMKEKQYQQGEREKAAGREELERGLLGVQQRLEQHRASNPAEAFKFSPEDIAVLAKAKMFNPTVAKTAPDDLPKQSGSLREVVNASSMLLRNPDIKGKQLSISDPQTMEVFNSAFLNEMQGGELTRRPAVFILTIAGRSRGSASSCWSTARTARAPMLRR